MNFLLPTIIGIVMLLSLGKVITPSVIESVKTEIVENTTISNQKIIYEAIQRYITNEKKYPTNIQSLIDSNYLSANANNNGFGGTYEIDNTISLKEKGIIKLKTTITDESAQETFLNSFSNEFSPIEEEPNVFTTSFTLPTHVIHGNEELMDTISISTTPPTNSIVNNFWYDTSNNEVILKVWDGANWKSFSDGSESKYYVNVSELGVGQVGDKKYAYDSSINKIKEYVYYNGSWSPIEVIEKEAINYVYANKNVPIYGSTIPRTTYSYSSSSCPSGYSTNSDPAKPCVKTETTYVCPSVGKTFDTVTATQCIFHNWQSCPKGSAVSIIRECRTTVSSKERYDALFNDNGSTFCYNGDKKISKYVCETTVYEHTYTPRPYIPVPYDKVPVTTTTYANLVYSSGSGYNPCPSGYETSGSQCRQIIGYTCPVGYTDNGSNCKKPK